MNLWRFLPLCRDDLDAVVTIENQSFDSPWELPSIRGEMENPQSLAFVLRSGTQGALSDLGAYIFLRILMDEVHIMKLATSPDRRRQGLAVRLTEQALNEACREGCCRAILEVRPSNLAAVRLYRHLGFKTVGERKRYYRQTGEDALVMAKNIEEAS